MACICLLPKKVEILIKEKRKALIETNRQRVKLNRIAAVFIAPIIGAFLGYQLASVMNYGWHYSKWHPIESPPESVDSLVALQRDSIWIQGESGAIYYNENSSMCTTDCWDKVSSIPILPVEEGWEDRITNETCVPLPPLSKVSTKVSECRITMWEDFTYSFALREDGSIYHWEAAFFKEWAFLNLFFGALFGAVILFIPTLFIIITSGLLDRLSNRAREKEEEKSNAAKQSVHSDGANAREKSA